MNGMKQIKENSACSSFLDQMPNSADLFADFQKIDIFNLSKEELVQEIEKIGEKSFRAAQIWQWLYHFGACDFSQMSNISKSLQEKLKKSFKIQRVELSNEQISVDGTRKWLLKLADGNEVETVFIPEENRGTLCISSQVGCALTCKFCHTGTQKLVKNLSSAEIVGQILFAKDRLNDWPDSLEFDTRQITNIVMMGMGEPLLNYENVAKAINILKDPSGISLSKRKITLSTSGIVPKMAQCGEELDVELAVSLHATNDELRDELVPINKKHPIKELLDACRAYPASSNSRRITFEYVMLKNVNDSDDDAKSLIKLIKNIPAKINLIPFNPWPGSIYECSEPERIEKFAKIINDAGYSSPVRKPRGQDIFAACGQLKSESVRKSKSILTNVNA